MSRIAEPETLELIPLDLTNLRHLANSALVDLRDLEICEGALPPPRVAADALVKLNNGTPSRWCVPFLIVSRNTVLGTCRFKAAPAHGSVEIGYEVAESQRGKGIATAAVMLLMQMATSSGLVQQVVAHILPDNVASSTVVSRLGFVKGDLSVDDDGETVECWSFHIVSGGGQLTKKSRGLIVTALLMSTFIVALEATVISAVMPIVVSDIGGLSLYAWAFSIFLLVQAVTMPFYGRLADSIGRKPLFLASMALFLLGSLGCGAAQSMPMLIFLRAVQALGAAGLIPIEATMMADVTTPAERPRFLGYVSAVFGLSAIVGPPVGAVLVETFGWPYVFWMPIPIGLGAAWIIASEFKETVQHAPSSRLDLTSAVLLTFGIGTMIFALLEPELLGVWKMGLLALLGASVTTAIIWRDRNRPGAIIPVYLLRKPILRIANASAFLCGAIMMGITIYLPLYIVSVIGAGPIIAGTALGIMTVSWTLASVGVGRVLHRFRYRPAALLGSLIVVSGCAATLAVMELRSENLIYVACGLLGIGLGIQSITFTIATQSTVGVTDRARSTTMFYFLRLTGQTIGSALLGGLLSFSLAAATLSPTAVQAIAEPAQRHTLAATEIVNRTIVFNDALQNIFWVVAILSLVLLVLAIATPATLRVVDSIDSSVSKQPI